MDSVNSTISTNFSRQSTRSRTGFFREIINTFTFKKYKIIGNRLFLITKSAVIYVAIILIDFGYSLLIKKELSLTRFLNILLSFVMCIFSSLCYSFLSDTLFIHILIYNLNTIFYYFFLLLIIRIFNLFENTKIDITVYFLSYFCMFLLSYCNLTVNVDFYDHKKELENKNKLLLVINQATFTNLLFLGI